MDPAERQQQIDNAHRAIGHFIAEFSQVIASMRSCMASRFAAGAQEERELAETRLGEVLPRQIADAFFYMCRTTNDLDDREQKIETWLRKKVTAAIEDRTNYAHGDWWIGMPGETEDKLSEPWLLRIKPRLSEKAAKFEPIPWGMLDKKAQELESLTMYLQTFGLICLEQPVARPRSPDKTWRGTIRTVRVEDALEMRGNRVRPKPEPPPRAVRKAAIKRVLEDEGTA